MFEPAFIGAVAGLVVAGLAVLGFWINWSERVTKAQGTSENALQVAAEADESCKEAHQRIDSFERIMAETSDRARREFGETIAAMQHKIHTFETWSRDEFVRKQSLEMMLARNEKAQEIRDERLEKRLDRIEKKIDESTAFRSA